MTPFIRQKCDLRTLAFAVTFAPSRPSSIDDGAQGTQGRFLPGPLCVRIFFVTYSIPFSFLSLGFYVCAVW